jgi:hypothetical protein
MNDDKRAARAAAREETVRPVAGRAGGRRVTEKRESEQDHQAYAGSSSPPEQGGGYAGSNSPPEPGDSQVERLTPDADRDDAETAEPDQRVLDQRGGLGRHQGAGR